MDTGAAASRREKTKDCRSRAGAPGSAYLAGRAAGSGQRSSQGCRKMLTSPLLLRQEPEPKLVTTPPNSTCSTFKPPSVSSLHSQTEPHSPLSTSSQTDAAPKSFHPSDKDIYKATLTFRMLVWCCHENKGCVSTRRHSTVSSRPSPNREVTGSSSSAGLLGPVRRNHLG